MSTPLKRAVGAMILLGLWPISAAVHAQEPTAAPEPRADGAAESGDSRRIDVHEYRIDGNTVLEAGDIELAVEPFLGPQRTIDDIQQARTALEAAYRKRGYETV